MNRWIDGWVDSWIDMSVRSEETSSIATFVESSGHMAMFYNDSYQSYVKLVFEEKLSCICVSTLLLWHAHLFSDKEQITYDQKQKTLPLFFLNVRRANCDTGED